MKTNKTFKVIEEFYEQRIENQELTTDDYLNDLSELRNKIRDIARILLSVSGMLLSTNFIVLFFIIKDNHEMQIYNISFYLSVLTIIFVIISFHFFLKSVQLGRLKGVSTKGEKLMSQTIIHAKEHKNITIGYGYLVSSIFLFLINIFVLAYSYYIFIPLVK